jgi:hypothetical protein
MRENSIATQRQFKDGKLIMSSTNYNLFLQFLQNDLALSRDCLAIAERSMEQHQGPLPMVLWQYGLVTLEELDKIYDWLEQV